MDSLEFGKKCSAEGAAFACSAVSPVKATDMKKGALNEETGQTRTTRQRSQNFLNRIKMDETPMGASAVNE
jgi:hypothetical protein